uniref:Uncharacterized protein n=1 Tax=Anopheles atroparvus TaxID=41427 RepID=A0AAG5DJ11_ANOAO
MCEIYVTAGPGVPFVGVQQTGRLLLHLVQSQLHADFVDADRFVDVEDLLQRSAPIIIGRFPQPGQFERRLTVKRQPQKPGSNIDAQCCLRVVAKIGRHPARRTDVQQSLQLGGFSVGIRKRSMILSRPPKRFTYGASDSWFASPSFWIS